MVLTKLNPTILSIKKEVVIQCQNLNKNKQEQTRTSNLKQYNQATANPIIPPNPRCSVSDRW